MRKFLFALLFVFSSTITFAGNGKTRVLKGQVIDSNGSPVVGAKVTVKGIEKPVYTDFDGEFVFPKTSSTSCEINVSMVSFEESSSTVDLQTSNNESLFITLEGK